MEFTQRWLLMFAIAAGLFAISFLLLRVNIRTLVILLGIGLPLVTLWLYMDAKYFSAQGRSISSKQACVCPVCKHPYARMCLEEKCSCCLITKGEKVIGHSSSPFQ
ncbi:MAG: hypothetical protein ACJ70O_07355 [Nitrososphaera sp.]